MPRVAQWGTNTMNIEMHLPRAIFQEKSKHAMNSIFKKFPAVSMGDAIFPSQRPRRSSQTREMQMRNIDRQRVQVIRALCGVAGVIQPLPSTRFVRPVTQPVPAKDPRERTDKDLS